MRRLRETTCVCVVSAPVSVACAAVAVLSCFAFRFFSFALRCVALLCFVVVLCCFDSPWRSCLYGRWRRRRCPTTRRRVRVRPLGRSSRRVECVCPSVVCRLGSHRPAPTASSTDARMVGHGSCRCHWRSASACPAACGLCIRSCVCVLCVLVCLFRFSLFVITHNHVVSQQRASYRVWRQRLGLSLRINRCERKRSVTETSSGRRAQAPSGPQQRVHACPGATR